VQTLCKTLTAQPRNPPTTRKDPIVSRETPHYWTKERVGSDIFDRFECLKKEGREFLKRRSKTKQPERGQRGRISLEADGKMRPRFANIKKRSTIEKRREN